MAITFDTKTQSGLDTVTSPKTWSHTCTGSNRLLVVVAHLRISSDVISGITYAGAALTLARANNNATRNIGVEIWYKFNPASGANNVVASSTPAPASNTWDCIAASFAGVDQTAPLDVTAINDGSSANPSIPITPSTNNQLIVAGLSDEEDGITNGTGETLLFGTDEGTWGTGSLYHIQTTAGAQTMDWTATTDVWAAVAATFKEATGGVSTVIKDIIGSGITPKKR